MGFLAENGVFVPLHKDVIDSCDIFTCGEVDLDEFFHSDCLAYEKFLFGKSYCFVNAINKKDIICAFTVANASIFTKRLMNARKKKVGQLVHGSKRDMIYPAVLIGRLGISTKYHRMGIGTELMDFIKAWFTDTENKTGCRYLVVDAYNSEIPISYYRRNGFEFMFSTEEQEREYRNLVPDEKLNTRLMYFDLIRVVEM